MKSLLLILVIISSLFGNPLSSSHLIYEKNFKKIDSGIYEKEDILFTVCNINTANSSLKKNNLEAKCMISSKSLLKNYILDSIAIEHSFNYTNQLKKDFESFIKTKFSMNFEFSFQTRILSNNFQKKMYRYVVALSKDEVIQVKNKYKMISINSNDYLDDYLKYLEYNKEYEKLHEFYKNNGLYESSILTNKINLSQIYYLNNYYFINNSFGERNLLRKILKEKDFKISYLKDLPANKEILSSLSANSKSLNDQIIFKLVALIDNYEKKDFFKTLSDYADSNLVNLYKVLNEDIIFFEQTPILRNVKKTFGHMYIDDKLSNKSNEYFQKADSLFKNGQNPEKILNYLVSSINISPNHFNSWDYLGAILKNQAKYKEALIIFNQAYQLNHNNEVLANISDCYYELGFTVLAKNNIFYLEILNKNEKNKIIEKIINKIKKG